MKKITLKHQLTEFLLYNSPNWEIKVEVFLYEESLWLNQNKIAELFNVDITTINEHIKNIYKTWELKEKTTIGKFPIVQKEWNREVKRNINFYNLDLIIAVWYRVNSNKATQFRIWATNILKEFILKGFVIDDEKLKNWKYFWKDYFKELLERIKSIRSSERRIYQQITDIFAECSIDYDINSDIAKNFYAMIQNKFHFAITWNTAAEIIYNKANRNKEYMWLTNWKNSPNWRILKSDVIIAKNYLKEIEIKDLEWTISNFFDYLERIVKNRITMKMDDLAKSVDKFLDFNEYKILEWFWKISSKKAKEKAISEYNSFNKTQKIISDFDKIIKMKK